MKFSLAKHLNNLHHVKFQVFTLLAIASIACGQAYNPTILQDSRDLPKTDGRFGFLYRTEDGIAHAAKSEGDGIIHGRYTYTDPTGFKLNFNYNAGTKVTPGYNYDQAANAPNYRAGNEEGYDVEQQRRTRPTYERRNEIYDDYGNAK